MQKKLIFLVDRIMDSKLLLYLKEDRVMLLIFLVKIWLRPPSTAYILGCYCC